MDKVLLKITNFLFVLVFLVPFLFTATKMFPPNIGGEWFILGLAILVVSIVGTFFASPFFDNHFYSHLPGTQRQIM